MIRFAASIAVLTAFIPSCSPKSDSEGTPAAVEKAKDDETEAASDADDADDNVAQVGTIALPETPDAAFATADASVTSLMAVKGTSGAFEGGGTTYAPGTVEIGLLSSSGCNSDSGEPIHTDSTKNTGTAPYVGMVQSLAEYPGAMFFCKLTENTYTFTSIRGAYDQARMLACGGKDTLTVNGGPVRVQMQSSNPCILDPSMKIMIDAPSAEGGMDGLMEYDIMVVKPSRRVAEGWDYDMYAGDLGDGSEAKMDAAMIRVSFKNSGSVSAFAFHTPEPNGSGIGGDTYELAIKFGETAELRYESRRQFVECASAAACDSGDRKYTRHTRLLATGTTNTDGEFLTLTKLDAIDSVFDWQNAEDLETDPSYIALRTLSGDATHGFKTTSYSAAAMPVDAPFSSLTLGTADGTTCFGGDLNCEGVTALKPAANTDLAFFLDPRGAGVTKSRAWYDARGPFTFSSVTFADTQD